MDDGSSDETIAQLQTIDDPRLQVHSQENAGPAVALNNALPFSRGSLIALLDHDDLWARDKIATQVAAMDRDFGLDLSFTWSRLVDDAGQPTGLHSHRWHGQLSFSQMVEDFVIGNTSAVLLRREALEKAGGFDPSFRLYYDMDLFLRVTALRPNNCAAVSQDLTFYRRHSMQISGDWRAMQNEWKRLLAKLEPDAPSKALRRGNANMTRYFAFLAYERRQFHECLDLLGQCAKLSPAGGAMDPRNAKLMAACAAGLLLPPRVHQWLESLAGISSANSDRAS